MKLVKAHVKNFRSIEDSTPFTISQLTCLVGKNEAGKSALLQALLGIKPITSYKYDKTRDYPRRFLTKFDERHPDGLSVVCETTWTLEDSDKKLLTDRFGNDCLNGDEVLIKSWIGEDKTTWTVPIDERKCLDNLSQKHALDAVERNSFKDAENAGKAKAALAALPQRSAKQEALLAEIAKCREGSFVLAAIDILSKAMPSFFYTSHFDRMSGEISINKLVADKHEKKLSIGDKIFLDFLEYAGTSIEELQQVKKHEELVAQCEAASNDITDEIFEFWSQNDSLAVRIALGEGKPEDPAPFNSGTIAKIRIENKNHRATIPLSERSAGFVWFFSFLAQFKQLRKNTGKAILLLDEPGLTLHGKAQSDLLKYIEDRLLPEHQVIFTTHSPFMVPMNRMSDIRIVQDVVENDAKGKKIVHGTKVKSDVLMVDEDTLFPLQGALGYEITQTLFVGKNILLVEGPSDIIFLTVFSEALRARGQSSLSKDWTICPSGGIDKILPFVSLFAGKQLNIAVLSDLAIGDKGKLERLKRSQILKAGQLFTVADFTGKTESDVEDLIDPELYAEILNKAFKLPAPQALTAEKLDAAEKSTERLVKKAEAAFRVMPAGVEEFNHYTPADWLMRNPDTLKGKSPSVTRTLDNFSKVIEAINALQLQK